jgi:hypothetical protein
MHLQQACSRQSLLKSVAFSSVLQHLTLLCGFEQQHMQDGSCARPLWCELVSYGLLRAELPAQYWVVKHACTVCQYHAILFDQSLMSLMSHVMW